MHNLVLGAAITPKRNKGTDSGGAAGIYGVGVSCRFPPLQRSAFPLFPFFRYVRLRHVVYVHLRRVYMHLHPDSDALFQILLQYMKSGKSSS